MDSLLLIGNTEEKLQKLLGKLGYSLLTSESSDSLLATIQSNLVDLILVSSSMDIDGPELCSMLRSGESTKKVPIVYLAKDRAEVQAIKELAFGEMEILLPPHAIGSLASVIATRLRLRKLAGGDDPHADLGQMNAALRDLNARFKKELEEARAIQQSLLPHTTPSGPGFEVAWSYQPLEEVGGDWFYIKPLPSGPIAMHIADVTGHGLAAAFIGSMTKLALTAANKEKPDELLGEVNRLMSPQLPQGRFVTMTNCTFDPATGLARCARAGHPPPLVLNRATNSVVELKAQGFAVGFFDSGTYTVAEQSLEPEDVLVIYTDGISEGQNRARENYGTKRLSEYLLATPRESSAQQILDGLIKHFHAFRDGRRLNDDVTVIVLRRKAVS